MDEILAQSMKKKAIDALCKTLPRIIDTGFLNVENNSLFVNLPRKSDGQCFLLRVDLPESFPLDPANYYFINPKNKTERSSQFWPNDEEKSFKISGQNPPWICLAGTSEYKSRHDNKYDHSTHKLSQIIIHIYRQINGIKKIG